MIIFSVICWTQTSNLKMITYKADLKTNIYYIFGFVILFGVTIPLSSKFLNSNWSLLIIFLFLFLLFNFLTFRLKEINLDKSNGRLTLIYKNYLNLRRTAKYDLKNIEFTYKIQVTSFRGGKKNVCTIYSANKKVIHVIPDDHDDWDENEIRSFVNGLTDAGVKKKFIGYSLKDV
jgi:hypothetical protein